MYTILAYEPAGSAKQMNPALFSDSELQKTSDLDEFKLLLEKDEYDLIFMEIEPHSMDLLDSVRQKYPYTPVIITSKTEKVDVVVEAMNRGAADYLVYPLSEARIAVAVCKAMELKQQKFEIDYHRRKQDVVYDFKGVIAKSRGMQDVLKNLEKFAHTDSTILITGETGTGKSFLSGTVHYNSPRKKKPFVKINCANIPEALLESELFGHEKGSFTSADKQRIGRFEQADGGTIFLDEIGEMSIGLQTKLLRVLEEKAFERIGGNRTIHVDIRVIAATNKNLVEQIDKGLFREDLYYRINVLPIRLPPLRERKECIVPLANVLLKKYCLSAMRDVKGFTPAAEEGIRNYDWPGNIRQLANSIERAVILSEGEFIRLEHLMLMQQPERRVYVPEPAAVQSVIHTSSVPAAPAKETYSFSLSGQERELILKALEDNLWVQKSAAKSLGISPRALNYKIRKYGITHPHWRRNKTKDTQE